MNFISSVNWITVILAGLFVIPVIVGIVSPFSRDRMRRSLNSLLSSIIFLAALLLALFLTGLILKNPDSQFLANVYRVIPGAEGILTSRNIWVWIMIAAVLTFLNSGILYLVTLPIYRFVIIPATEKISSTMNRLSSVPRRFLGALWELPRAAALVLIFALIVNFYSGYNGDERIKKEISRSQVYRLIDAQVLEPILSSSFIRQIPVLLNNTFKNAAATLQERNIRLIRYFNGMTLEEAIKSNADIDAKARSIVGKESEAAAKAKLLYTWICRNITYDNNKAAVIAADTSVAAADGSGVSSGAVVAFNTRTGICFDYACLYVAMCRAAGVQVRFVTGLGFSGMAWGDHAWNQVYDPAVNKWLNVDTTFGSSGLNYFDSADFDNDHQGAVVQDEW